MDEYMDMLDHIDRVDNEPIGRVIRDRLNPFEEYSERTFINRFRLSKEAVLILLNEINIVDNYKETFYTVPAMLQLLITLHFFSSSCYQRTDGDIFGIHRTTVCRIVKKISWAIASLSNRYIKFPDNRELLNVKSKFKDIAGIPGIVGAIDCTHIPIVSPGGDNAELYRNRKGFFSINVQAICDADLMITNLVARWYGSSHDNRIFENSEIYLKFENNEIQGILLGDNGYGLKRYLLTPVLNANTHEERHYNLAHSKTRVKVENLFGVLKRRFPCLSQKLRLKQETTLVVIVACCVLHNICRARNMENDEFIENNGPEQPEAIVDIPPVNRADMNGIAQRNLVIRTLNREHRYFMQIYSIKHGL